MRAGAPHFEQKRSSDASRLPHCGQKPAPRCGAPADEVATILTDNPARLYGFDLDVLRPIAERVGPDIDELQAADPYADELWQW